MTSPPWDVYADELLRLYKGWPLWDPEPSDGGSEVLIGDVGFLWSGAFIPVFNILQPGRFREIEVHNTTRAAPDRFHPKGAPPDFESFSVSDPPCIDRLDDIEAGLLGTQSVADINVAANVLAYNSGGGLQFRFTEDRAAGLIIAERANRKECIRSRRLRNYISQNHKTWVDYIVNELDMEVSKPEDIIVINGWVKTGNWATAAYVSGGKDAQVSLNGGWNGVSLNLSASRTMQAVAPPSYKAGPRTHHIPNRRDQTVFIKYYKLRKRFWWQTVVQAAAEPQDLSRYSPDLEGSAVPADGLIDDVIQVPEMPQAYDPVGDILTYILENSEAVEAIASVDDVYDLCKDEEMPSDFAELLRRKGPMIDVTEEGLGMIAFDQLISYESNALGESVPIFGAAHEGDGGSRAKAVSDNAEATAPSSAGEAGSSGPQYTTPGPSKEAKLDLILPNDDNTGGVRAFAISPDGRYIATGSVNFAVVLWDATTGERLRVLEYHEHTICSLSFSPNSQLLVSGSRDSRAIIWNIHSGEAVHVLQGHANLINTVLFSPDGRMIATGSTDTTIRLWNLDGTPRSVLRGHIAIVMLVAFSSNSQRIVSASADYTARLWSTAPGSQVSSTLDGHEGIIYCIAFSPDDRKVVTGSDDGSTRVWSAESSDELITLREHTGSVWAAVFSPDSRQVLSVASDGHMKICDSLTGEVMSDVEVNQSYNSSIDAAAFSKDTRLCATASDMTVKIWDTVRGLCLGTLDGHQDGVTHVWFSPNGETVVSAADDSTFRVWNLRQYGILPHA